MNSLGINPFASITTIADQLRRPILNRNGEYNMAKLDKPQESALALLCNGPFVFDGTWHQECTLRGPGFSTQTLMPLHALSYITLNRFAGRATITEIGRQYFGAVAA